eukprot:Skav223078  [mRNA]  locus=scaffold419:216655:216858:- [translate_table: standard]
MVARQRLHPAVRAEQVFYLLFPLHPCFNQRRFVRNQLGCGRQSAQNSQDIHRKVWLLKLIQPNRREF